MSAKCKERKIHEPETACEKNSHTRREAVKFAEVFFTCDAKWACVWETIKVKLEWRTCDTKSMSTDNIFLPFVCTV